MKWTYTIPILGSKVGLLCLSCRTWTYQQRDSQIMHQPTLSTGHPGEAIFLLLDVQQNGSTGRLVEQMIWAKISDVHIEIGRAVHVLYYKSITTKFESTYISMCSGNLHTFTLCHRNHLLNCTVKAVASSYLFVMTQIKMSEVLFKKK